MSGAYYNENDPEAVAALRQLIADGVIASGEVDPRSIKDVTAYDIQGFTQCHFFAGAGLWSVAARLAGWPDARPIWTASCPCQPLSVAGKGLGTDDPRHLWPDLYRILRTARASGYGPPILVGEQVAGAPGYGWFDGVRADLAREEIAARTIDIPACAIDAPHERHRLWWLAVADAEGSGSGTGLRQAGTKRHGALSADCDGGDGILASGAMEHAAGERRRQGGAPPIVLGRRAAVASTDVCERGCLADGYSGRSSPVGSDAGKVGSLPQTERRAEYDAALSGGGDDPKVRYVADTIRRNGSWWADADWIACHDGKARRTKSGIPMLVDGMVGRASVWRLAGNSIVPQLAAEVIGAFLDVERRALSQQDHGK